MRRDGRSSDYAAGDTGVRVNLSSVVNLANCGVKNCRIAVMAETSSIVTLSNNSEDGFYGSGTGAYAKNGWIILLSDETPDLLGGVSN